MIGRSTVSDIISETTQVIWETLKKRYVKCPTKPEEWRDIARGFEQRWNFPNCVGSIDGKHVTVEAPCNSGSENFNYKGSFSKILMAVCDSAYKFLYVEVGRSGGESDGGVFGRSTLCKALETGKLGIPQPTAIPGGHVAPYVILGDEAFPLKEYLMRPYPRRYIKTDSERIYNYRHARARRVIENAFGILTSRWRILRRRFKATDENVNRYVLACVALHNFLLTEKEDKDKYCPSRLVDTESWTGEVIDGEWRQDGKTVPVFRQASKLGSNRPSRTAQKVRQTFKNYFMGPGQVEWQLDYIHRNAPRQ
ncbi:uncharacterized protein LOC125940654 [Dermacentor silvarum]|uniref:uncharacterized protein LOC125940654 n=1 Tax=Dermacentor silvarum TaxID=543639 RepID=UPI002100BDE8|nr:uncharacterized protein LOC125940654 [Dermacentor silvarum]